MERLKIAEAPLKEILILETTKALGRDASFLGQQLEIRRRNGTSNWDASCGIAGTVVVKAFGIALQKIQSRYNND